MKDKLLITAVGALFTAVVFLAIAFGILLSRFSALKSSTVNQHSFVAAKTKVEPATIKPPLVEMGGGLSFLRLNSASYDDFALDADITNFSNRVVENIAFQIRTRDGRVFCQNRWYPCRMLPGSSVIRVKIPIDNWPPSDMLNDCKVEIMNAQVDNDGRNAAPDRLPAGFFNSLKIASSTQPASTAALPEPKSDDGFIPVR